MSSCSQNIEARNFLADFLIRFFFWWGILSHYAATPLIIAWPLGQSDITRFHIWSSIATGNHMDRTEKIPKIVQKTGTVEVFIRVQAFWDPNHGHFPHVQIFMRHRPNSLM